jgi:hypothetical protein
MVRMSRKVWKNLTYLMACLSPVKRMDPLKVNPEPFIFG